MVSSLHNRPIVPTPTTVTQAANTPPSAPAQAQAQTQAQQAAPPPKKGEAPRPFGSDSFARKAGGSSKLPPAAGELMEKLAAGDMGGAKKSLLALLEGGGGGKESLEELLADEGGQEAADNPGAGGAQKGQGSLGNLLLKALKNHPELAKGLLSDPRQLRELLKNPAKARAQLSGAGGLAELLGLSGPNAVDAVDNERSSNNAQRAHADELLGLDRVSRPPQKSDDIDNLAYV